MAVLERTTSPTQSGDLHAESGEHEGRMQTMRARQLGVIRGPFDKPTLKPYWGKPAVRNYRGGDGNVGIIRSPVRAIALPDQEVSCNVVGAARDSVPYHQGFGSHAVLARQLLTAIE